MTDFITQAFDRVRAQYEHIDVGAGAIFDLIAHQIYNGGTSAAMRIAQEAAMLYASDDHFIVEGETTNNDVLFEVFRRACYVPGEDADSLTFRQRVIETSGYLSHYALHLRHRAASVAAKATEEVL